MDSSESVTSIDLINTIRNSESVNIIDLISIIRIRPGMYLGDKNQLDNLYFIISGFFISSILNNIVDNDVDRLFRKKFSN